MPSLSTRPAIGRAFLTPCLAFITLMAASPGAPADVILPAILSDGMVLQRETDAPIWGSAHPGEKVTVTPSWPGAAEATATADPAGKWSVRVKTPAAGGPFTVAIKGDNAITLANVMVGEVWVCSGQSNMEWTLGGIGPGREGVPSAEEELKAAVYPAIRLFTVANTIAAQPRADCAGSWAACTPATAKEFSAVGYFFGRMLHKELDVPIGLISSDWGGTPAESWVSEQGLGEFPEFRQNLEAIAAARDPNKRGVGSKERLEAWWSTVDAAGKPPIPAAWATAGFDDSSWKTMHVPAAISGDGLENFDGIFYLRTQVTIPKEWEGKAATLELGPIDDRDDTWFNGTVVGQTHEDGRFSVARVYTIPAAAVKAGKSTVGVRVLDTGGPGGINGKPEQVVMRSADKSLAPIALAGDWRFHVGPALGTLPTLPQSADIGPNTPTALYNGMIAPITPMAIRGAIWYQGESNVGRAAQYRKLFPAMIRDWRKQWAKAGVGEFPFYFVQIAPFAYGNDHHAAELREAQLLTLSTPNTGMAVTMDIGNPGNIHPDNKQEVGRRLALWALAKTYAKSDLAYSGPLYKSMTVEGEKVRIRFEHGEGLKVMGPAPAGHVTNLRIAGADKQFFPAMGRVDGDTLVVSSRVKEPVAVRYCWGPANEGNLFNAAGLPASSFRTDEWEGPMTSLDSPPEDPR